MTLVMCAGVSRHMCMRSLAVGDGTGDGKRHGLAAEPVFSAPLESENSKLKLGLSDHHEGIFIKAGGWDIFYLTVY